MEAGDKGMTGGAQGLRVKGMLSKRELVFCRLSMTNKTRLRSEPVTIISLSA